MNGATHKKIAKMQMRCKTIFIENSDCQYNRIHSHPPNRNIMKWKPETGKNRIEQFAAAAAAGTVEMLIECRMEIIIMTAVCWEKMAFTHQSARAKHEFHQISRCV